MLANSNNRGDWWRPGETEGRMKSGGNGQHCTHALCSTRA